jgi:hydrogenase maturation protease
VSGRWTLLVCGDPARGDDGAALAAVDCLEPARRIGVRVRRVGQLEPDDLVAALATGHCIVVDAVRGVAPGNVVEVPLRRLAAADGPVPASTHALPLQVVIGIAEALGADIDEGTFIGIGGSTFELGSGISTRARRGLDACAGAIDRRIHARGAARCA